jgi:hypothetical protein
MHSFDPQIAARVGVNAAVLYQNIVWWCAKNAANRHNQHDGRFWTYNSVKAWAELFPYLSAKQIRSSLDRLEEEKLILSGCFNASAYDRTKWYCPETQPDLPIKANEVDLLGEPIPDINPDIKPDLKTRGEQIQISATLSLWASPEAVASFIAYRKRSKAKALTVTAAKRLAANLQEIFNAGGDTDDALGLAEERGWQSIKPEWYFNDKQRAQRGADRQGSGMAAAFAAVAARSTPREG